MKRFVIVSSTIFIFLLALFTIPCRAETKELFEEEKSAIEDRIDDDVKKDMEQLDVTDVDDVIAGGIDPSAFMRYLTGLLSAYSTGPLASLITMTAVILLASVGESYTYSLRYTETRDIMGVVVSLFLTSMIVSPLTEIAASSVSVIQAASSIMTVYLPVMAGIMAFSGHMLSSGGYYAAVVTAAQFISKSASTVLAPLLNVFLSLSVSVSITSKVRLNGLIETVTKGFKYGITFVMSVFVAVLGLNGALSSSADGVANKAARFGLSSFIPLIGASVSEAYGTIQNSVGILRSGIGIFVIVAVFVSFAPLLIRSVLWSAALGLAKSIGEMMSVSSAAMILNALMQFLSALRVLLIAVMTVFIISSSIMISLGGQS